MMNLHPLRSRHIATLFPAELQTRFLANAQHLADVVNRLNPRGVTVLIEKGVARNLNRIGKSDVSVRVMLCSNPAREEVVAVAHAAATVVMCVREIFGASQSGQCRDELECRSGRQRADGAV